MTVERMLHLLPNPRTALLAVLLAAVGPGWTDADQGHGRLGEARHLLAEGRYLQAEAAARTALEWAEREHGPRSARAADALDVLVESVWLAGSGGDEASRELAERAVALREELHGEDHPAIAASLDNLGALLSEIDRLDAARQAAERALAIRRRAFGSGHPEAGKSLNLLASIVSKQEGPDLARPLWEEALGVLEAGLGPDHPEVARSLSGLGESLSRAGRPDEARPYLDRALAIRRGSLQAGHPLIARSLHDVGRIQREAGDFTGARAGYEEALELLEERLGPDHPETAPVRNSLGLVLRDLGEVAGAREQLERALAIWERSLGPEHLNVAGMLNNLANLVKATGDYEEARRLLERSLHIREKVLGEDHGLVAQTLTNLADVYHQTRHFEQAITLLRRAVAIRERVAGPDSPRTALSLTNLGETLRAAGELEQARPILERALALLEIHLPPDHELVANTLNNLGLTLHRLGERQAAWPLYERALRAYESRFGPGHPNVATCLWNQALWLAEEGRTEGALRLALRSEEVSREHLRWSSRYLSEREALGNAAARTWSLDLGLALAAAGRLDDRPDLLRAAWDALIRSRNLVLEEVVARHRLVARSGDSELDRLHEEVVRAGAELARLAIDPGRAGAGDPLQALEEARRSHEALARALAVRSAPFRRATERSGAGLDQVEAALPPGSALVAYAEFGDPLVEPRPNGAYSRRYMAFVLRAGDTRPLAVPLGPAEALEEAIAAWHQEAARGLFLPGRDAGEAEAAYRAAAEQLRAALWDPFARYLGGVRRVFVAPAGQLHLVSPASLPSGNGRYLAEAGYIVHLLTAERDLAASDEPPGRGLLAVGAPAFDAPEALASRLTEEIALIEDGPARPTSRTTLRGRPAVCPPLADLRFLPLPETEAEARGIALVWRSGGGDGSESLFLTGTAASEAAVKSLAPGRRILHLATHGFFLGASCYSQEPGMRGIGGLATQGGATGTPPPPDGRRLLSGLALAGANERSAASREDEDGILTAQEIALLDLSGVEWAVLSACETGAGEIAVGEGVLGLRRAFLQAGVQTVIMSLWAAEDRSAREWMTALYRARVESGLSTAEAVHAARVEILGARRTRGESTHPFFWGGFLAVGDWR